MVTVQEILNRIEDRVTKEDRTPDLLYAEAKKIGTGMVLTGKLDGTMLEAFCSDIISLYIKLQR